MRKKKIGVSPKDRHDSKKENRKEQKKRLHSLSFWYIIILKSEEVEE